MAHRKAILNDSAAQVFFLEFFPNFIIIDVSIIKLEIICTADFDEFYFLDLVELPG